MDGSSRPKSASGDPGVDPISAKSGQWSIGKAVAQSALPFSRRAQQGSHQTSIFDQQAGFIVRLWIQNRKMHEHGLAVLDHVQFRVADPALPFLDHLLGTDIRGGHDPALVEVVRGRL